MRFTLVLLFAPAALGIAGRCAADSEPNALTEEEKKAGFELLFNGRDLQGWEQPGNWKVEGGAIMRRGRGGKASCQRQIVGDCELRFEWRAAKKCDFADDGFFCVHNATIPLTVTSGSVNFNTGKVSNAPARVFDQVQVTSTYMTAAGDVTLQNRPINIGERKTPATPSYSYSKGPLKAASRPIGQWNSSRIVWRGSAVEYWLNGEKVIDMDLATASQDKSLGETGKALSHVLSQRELVKNHGVHLCLGDGESEAWFRGIKLRAGKSENSMAAPAASGHEPSSTSPIPANNSVSPSAASTPALRPSIDPQLEPLKPSALGTSDMTYMTSCIHEQPTDRPPLSIHASPPLDAAVVSTWGKAPAAIAITLDYPIVKNGRETVLDLSSLAGVPNLATLLVGKGGFLGAVEGPAKGEGFASFQDNLRFLAGKPTLTHLRIRRCVISAEAAENIALLPKLASLRLMYCDLKGNALAALAKSKSLRCLDVTASDVDDASVRQLANCPQLEHLVLVNTPITEEAFASWSGTPPLKVLDISGTRFAGSKLDRLSQFRRLEELNAAGLGVAPDAVLAVAKSCPLKTITLTLSPPFGGLCETLASRRIQVRDGKPGKRTVEHPFSFTPEAVVAKPHAYLEIHFSLNVPTMYRWKDMTVPELEGLGGLRGNWLACKLDMYHPRNDDTHVLDHFKNMHCIQLEQSSIGFVEELFKDNPALLQDYRKEVQAEQKNYARILGIWQSSSTLQEIEFKHCSMSTAAVACLGKITSLRALNLLQTGVDDSVGAALAQFPRLERLRLHGREITDRAVRDLSASTSIRFLDLSTTSVTDACVDSLLQMPSLKEVHLHETQLSQAAGQRLAERKITVLHNPRQAKPPEGWYVVEPDVWIRFDPPVEQQATTHIE